MLINDAGLPEPQVPVSSLSISTLGFLVDYGKMEPVGQVQGVADIKYCKHWQRIKFVARGCFIEKVCVWEQPRSYKRGIMHVNCP